MYSYSLLAASIWGGLASLPIAAAQSEFPAGQEALGKVFQGLPAQKTLTSGWKSCNGTFECNRLEVPLDWSKPNGKKATIALTKSVGISKSHGKRKTYLINPGGPGIAGTATIVNPDYYKFFRSYLGPDVDIVGWDPRSVGFSTPNVTCLLDRTEAQSWFSEYYALFAANDTLKDQYLSLKSFGETCNYVSGGEDGIVQYSSTATNVRDMKAIIEAIDGKDAVLNYHGLSYGTIYGLTFASMFPEKLGSVILDGNADPTLTVDQLKVADELRDGPSVLNAFFTECAKAGPARCAFYQKDAKDIEKAFNAIIAKLDKEPYAGTYISSISGKPAPFVLTRPVLENLLFQCEYDPRDTFTYLAQAFALFAADNGNITGFGLLADNAYPVTYDTERQFEAEINTACADFQIYDNGKFDVASMKEVQATLRAKSWVSVSQWTTIDLACRAWPVKSKKLFRGPYTPGKHLDKTKGKILFLNNKYDPVTPWKNADKYSKVFGGGLLTINGVGHTTLTTYNDCVSEVVRTFVDKGTLPAKDKTCDQDLSQLFPPLNATSSA